MLGHTIGLSGGVGSQKLQEGDWLHPKIQCSRFYTLKTLLSGMK